VRVALLIISFILFLPVAESFDVAIKWVKVDKETVYDGELVEIKARVERIEGNESFAVSFYYDEIDSSHLIGRVHYDSINYYRLPSIIWDTKNKVGKHRIIVCVKDDNESNSIAYCNVTVLSCKKANLLISEVYYHCYPHRNNEYIAILNAGDKEVNLEGYYITTQPWKRIDKQNKIIFPKYILKPGEKIYITQNGTSFKEDTGFDADYEYYNCSSLPDMKRVGSFILSNEGGVVCLKNKYNHTIDVVVYGNAYFNEGWSGESVHNVAEGIVLKRKDAIDTNTSKDWEYNRTYVIGQSDFPPFYGEATFAIAFCSPDCSYDIVANEIKNASFLLINLYLFTNPFLAEILNKSNAEIRILLDGNVYGGIPMEERYIAYMLSKKAEIRYMLNDEENGIYKRYKYDHAKYVVLDNGFIIHSANWAKSGIPKDNTYGNREWGIVVKSENGSEFLKKVFYYDWNYRDCVEYNETSFTHGKPPEDFSISYYVPKGNYKPKFDALKINTTFNFSIILAPDNAEEEIINLIKGAKEEILVEQAYIQLEWEGGLNPFIREVLNRNKSGIKVYVILNKYEYGWSSVINKETKEFLEENGIKVKLHSQYTIHNKGLIIDGEKVLISSINWGENSVRRNREIGVVVEDKNIASYFEDIFWYAWNYKVEKTEGGIEIFYTLIAFLLIILRRRIK